jgi:hypothetical protein
MTEHGKAMDLLHLVQKTIANEPDVVLLSGRCIRDESVITIYPKPQDETLSLVVKQEDMIEGPMDVEVSLEQYAGQGGIQAVKLRKGSRVLLRESSGEREVELTPAADRENACSFASSTTETATRVPTHPTQCIFLAEFSCFTGGYVGFCFGFWDCGFVETSV